MLNLKTLLPYYKLQKIEKDKNFFYDHSGYFNFWDEYLLLRDKNYSDDNNVAVVLVNRINKKFRVIKKLKNKKVYFNYVMDSYKYHKPKEMFEDFPELLDSYY